MNKRYFPLQKRRIRRLWHPSTVKTPLPEERFWLAVDDSGEVDISPILHFLPPYITPKMHVSGLVGNIGHFFPKGTYHVWDSKNLFQLRIPSQPLRISAKIRKLYEP